MHILFIIDSLHPGGAERQLVELIKGLVKNVNYKISLGVLDNTETGYEEIIRDNHIHVNLFPRKSRLDFRTVFAIRSFIMRNSVDLVHGYLNLGAFYGMVAAKLSGRPVVCSSIRNAKDENIQALINIQIESRVSDILVSNSMAGFRNRFKRMRPHFHVIYNGIDFDRFQIPQEDIDAVKREFNLTRFKTIIGMTATFSDYKDYESVVLAAQFVLREYPDTGFLFIGGGANLERIKALATETHLNNKIIFTGHRADVEKFYPVMNLFVLMTRADLILEGISNSLLEAMASGVPVIASSGGGTDELIMQGETGIVVPPGDHVALAHEIILFLKNPDKQLRLAQKAKNDVQERFNLDRYVQDHITLYNELVTLRRPAYEIIGL